MKTTDLIAALAADASPVDPGRTEARFHGKMALGATLALVAMLSMMNLRTDLAAAWTQAMFWVKVVFPGSLAVMALVGLHRLGLPGARLGRLPLAAAAVLMVVWAMAGMALLDAPDGERLHLVLGQSSVACSAGIALLSVPALALAFWAARELAPTRLALAGAAAGLFAGAVAATAYTLHCPETQAPFLAVWYVLGMLVPAAVGAALGRRVLRW